MTAAEVSEFLARDSADGGWWAISYLLACIRLAALDMRRSA